MKTYPCDEFGVCPFNAIGGYDCYNNCGLGADEDCDEPNYYPDESMQNYPD